MSPTSFAKMVSAVAYVLVALAPVACSVTGLKERDPAVAENQCSEDADCGGSARCSGDLCVARTGTLSTLLVELIPAANAGDIAGAQFFTQVFDAEKSAATIDVPLDEVSVVGWVQSTVREGCEPMFPVQVTFVPSEGRLDLPVIPRTAAVDAQAPSSFSDSTLPLRYHFATRLAAGTYDVYVVPFEPSPPLDPIPASCALAPQLIRGQTIVSDGASETELQLTLPLPQQLELEVRWPEDLGNLRDWTVDIIEDDSARVISNRVRLGASVNESGTLVYSVSLAYLPVLDESPYGAVANARELVRLTPPSGLLAATVLFDREAIELFSPGHAVVDQLPKFGDAVQVEGAVLEAATGLGRASQLSFVATKLASAADGVLTAFSRTIETRENGSFKVELLPGTYRVRATPESGFAAEVPLASGEAVWSIAAMPRQQAGRAIELLPAATISGRALLGSGVGARGAIATAEASPWNLTMTTLERETGGPSAVPRATSTTISGDNGAFVLSADPGTFDFSIRTPDGSRLAWFVKPGLEVAPAGADVSLAAFELPPPVPLQMTARLLKEPAGTPRLGGALVRVYALLDRDGVSTRDIGEAESVVAIAESRLDSAASTTVYVPAMLDASITSK